MNLSAQYQTAVENNTCWKLSNRFYKKIFYGANYFATWTPHQSSYNEINFYAMVLISVYFMYSFNQQPLSFIFKKFSYQQLSSIKSLVPLTVLVFAQWNNSSCNLSERNWTTTHSGLPPQKSKKSQKKNKKETFSKLGVLFYIEQFMLILYSKVENGNVSPIYQKACIFFT